MADQTFGEFIASKRDSFGVPLRRMAERLDITAQYLSDIEKGRRNPPEIALLEKMATEFNLNAQEKILLFELAGNERDEVPPDLPDYIKSTDIVRVALRKAKDMATEDDWKQFIDKLNRKGNTPE